MRLRPAQPGAYAGSSATAFSKAAAACRALASFHSAPQVVAAEQVLLVGLYPRRASGLLPGWRVDELHLQRRRDGAGNLVLDAEHAGEFPIRRSRPRARTPSPAFASCAVTRIRISMPCGRCPRGIERTWSSRPISAGLASLPLNQNEDVRPVTRNPRTLDSVTRILLGNPVGQVVLVLSRAHVGEGEHRDGAGHRARRGRFAPGQSLPRVPGGPGESGQDPHADEEQRRGRDRETPRAARPDPRLVRFTPFDVRSSSHARTTATGNPAASAVTMAVSTQGGMIVGVEAPARRPGAPRSLTIP